jgi:trans-aconitate 2-methyltransferase
VSYVFADTDVAGRRLALVAEVFAPATVAFLRDAVPRPPALAVDLGCGPGHTTRLLAGVVRPGRTVGLDSSSRFVDAARAAGGDGIEFRVHDVTSVPFPTPPAELLHCRFLLSHLADPPAALATWATQLVPGGRLLVTEVDAIRTSQPTFTTYLEIVDGLLASTGGRLYVGRTLDAVHRRRTTRRIATLAVPNRRAAAMLALNLPSWRDQAYVRAHYDDETLARIASELDELAAASGDVSEITWELRELVIEHA